MNEKNYARVHPLAPVVAIDIDGTLGDYHSHFTWFASMYLQEEVRMTWRPRFQGEFSDALGLDKRTYRDIKLAYRQGGMKRSMPVFDQAGRVVQAIRAMNIQVWIATTRPWNRLDNIDPDTQFWINRNIGKVDGVIYGEDKYADLVDIVSRERILGVVDDIPENVERASGLGLAGILMGGPHNAYYSKPVQKIHYVSDILQEVRMWEKYSSTSGDKEHIHMKLEPPPEELGYPPNSGFTATVDLLTGDTPELEAIVRHYLPQWLELFEEKNRKYAGLEGNELGASGKFVDVYRKVKVLKSRIWDGHEELGENNREIIHDLIGHLFLMLYDLDKEGK